MATLLSIFTALPTLWKFWGEFKVILTRLQSFKNDLDRKRFLKNLTKASEATDSTGDTSGYEDIIRGGKK